MGLDGFSMANLGQYNRLTSAQMSNEVDLWAAKGNDTQIKDIDGLSSKNGITRKEFDFSETGGQAFMGGDTEAADEDELMDNPEQEITSEDDPEHGPNRFEMRIDSNSDVVELYDNYLELTVQRLSAKDMLHMIKKFDDPAGILVNKKA
ncbi:hypothetical protein IJE86_06695 [bacterium]|nr:hypothetical protein [bacterium]